MAAVAAAAAVAPSNSLFDVAFRSSSSSSFAPRGQGQAVFIRASPRRKSPRRLGIAHAPVVDNLGQQEHSSSSSSSTTTTTTTKTAPASAALAAATTKIQRGIPGSYGPPLLGAIRDRLYFIRGVEEFLRSRAEQHGSTVFRINVPPGPPFFPDSRVIVLLDQKSFPVLFDTSKVSKKNVFTGTYMPSTSFTGGYRVLSYLDPEEPKHAQLKAFCFDLLKSNGPRWIPEFHAACSSAFDKWEQQLLLQEQQNQKNQKNQKQQGAELKHTMEQFVLSFLTKCVLDRDAADGLSGEGPALIKNWLAPQIVPVLNVGLPLPIEMLLHMFLFPVPFFPPVSGAYQKIVDFFSKHGGRALDIAARHGIQPDEALHNLVFFVCFNTYGGLIRLLPSVLQHVHEAGQGLQQELKAEIRAAVEGAPGGTLSMKALESMPLLQSTIYEVLRISPPVAFQYGRAKRDLVIETHREAFRVKEGEMLFGYQPFATRDPEVFHKPDEFLPKRFMGDEGKRMLKHLIWSNGPENEAPQVSNKQCAGKDFVLLVARLFVAELFLRFDSFELGKPEKKGPETIYRFTSLLKREMSVAAAAPVGQ